MPTYSPENSQEVSFVQSTLVNQEILATASTFDACESTATLSLDITGMDVGVSYKGTVSLSDTTTFNKHIAVASASLTLAKDYTWVSLGEGEWFDNLALMSSTSYGIQKVEVLKADGFYPYWYIDGLGGFGTKYPCFLSLPGGPALESWL